MYQGDICPFFLSLFFFLINMKFGSRLKEAILPDWEPYYLDYDALKKKLGKAQEHKGAFTDRDETEFVEMLDSNLEKVKKKTSLI